MKHISAVSFILAVSSVLAQTPNYGAAGRFSTAYRIEDIPGTTEIMSGSRIYYPDSSGMFPQSAVPAPIIVFGHGWQMGIDRYYSYAQHLASWGYVVCLPTISNPLINPEHDKRARLMVDAARWVSARDTVVGDRFYRKLDRWNWGFAGHSMGGGLSMLAADLFGLADTLRAAVAIHSPQTDPATRSANIRVPKLVLAGGVDNIAPWRDVRQAFWDSAPPPGTFAVIRGANHGYVMDYSYFWENGGTSQITREQHQLIIRRHMTAYFERYLQGDTSNWNFRYCFGDSIKGHPSMDSVEVRLPPVGAEERAEAGPGVMKLNPSVVRGMLRIDRTKDTESEMDLLDPIGRRVVSLVPGDNDVTSIPPGVYFICRHVRGVPKNLVSPSRVVIAR